MGNRVLAKRPACKQGRFETLIEFKENGCVVVAPSHGPVHPSRKAYVLESGGLEHLASFTSDEEAALHALAVTFDETPPPKPPRPPPLRHNTGDSPGNRPGDRFNTRAIWEEILIPAGWVRVYERGDMTYWRRPGKERDISATTNRKLDLLYVFSTSTPFKTGRSYDKFGAYAVLYHDGDLSAAARELRRLEHSGDGGKDEG